MAGIIRLGLVVIGFALIASVEASADGSGPPISYLAALQKSSSEPNLYRPQQKQQQQQQQQPQGPSQQFQRNNYQASSARQFNGRGNGGGRDHGGCRNTYNLDYIMLTLQWGPGFCATSPIECKRKENKLFTIHGMWPQFNRAYSPAFCCFDNTFNYDVIEPLLPALEKYWFSYYDKNSRGFWSHEWLKHGTCLRDVKQLQGEEMFFGTTLNIVKQLPVLETLAKAGIVPGDNKVYPSVAIQDALKKLTGGKSAKVECDLEAHQPIALLKGVDFCFDNELKFTDCPPSKSRCQRQLMFLN